MVRVAPLVGAWIETIEANMKYEVSIVAPLVGAWIETIPTLAPPPPAKRRSPRGSVD